MKKRVIALGAMTFGVLGLAIGTMVFVRAQKEPFRMPAVISRVAPIQVLETRFKDRDEGGSEPSAKIYLKNNSDKTIIGFTVESGDEKEADGYGEVRISDESGPVAEPRSDFAIDIPIGNFKTSGPLRINAVAYDDGSFAGEVEAVSALNKRVQSAFASKGRRVEPK